MIRCYGRALLLSFLIAGLFLPAHMAMAAGGGSSAAAEAEPEKGPHRGRMLRDGDFALELAIVEAGVPPEFRVWITDDGEAVPPESVDLTVTLTRLGDKKDVINFRPQEDFLRGDMEIYEPHSFVVTIVARYQGETHTWEYDNFEGRVRIADDVASAMGIVTERAGSATLIQRIPAFGRVIPATNAQQRVTARFDGEITAIHVALGQAVSKGDALITVESNESLKPYTLRARLSGEVVSLPVNVGESTAGRALLHIVDPTALLAELQVFPADLSRLAIGNSAELRAGSASLNGNISYIPRQLSAAQSAPVRVAIAQSTSRLQSGQFIQGDLEVDRFEVPLAVKRSGLQGFRDFTVVYAKVGDQYEVRMLELGREAGEWVEVLGGLEPGTEYVSENSFLIKADIEKSGASHDH
ncbi:Biotin-lipoyl like/HlyD family secretion protein [Spongiibacter sp. IMCC21906]|jgi:cobalt-zinc-cadmium efflux system membrane fusion protein|uniref:efflux RND transporter periplasmic adaptor subunit n=1 Tax=Spongiibacter sp. IMCC21906 TaxID=1620392 RepID=UPI00062DFEEA|nr:HlyD family efflux transporter periplasmic adaptor subunit [Spongiibacter sp. IMCC21906]AKH68781.1 Biotin-lipoyl like/HlyD family secretion protein [Spongiibacter sp. IMCC21906]